MAQISKYPISKDVYERIFDIFLRTAVDLHAKSQASNFFEEFLTPTERIMLAKRLAIGVLLAKKYDYQDISKVLHVSKGTIGNVSSRYKYGNEFHKVIDKILIDEKLEVFFLKVGEIVSTVASKSGPKSSGWIYLRNEIKKKKRHKPF